MTTDAVAALFLPVPETLPGRTLFINARPCAEIERLNADSLQAQQYFRPHARILAESGYVVTPHIPMDGTFDSVLVAGARQHTETISSLAAGLLRLKSGGFFAAAAANDEGGKRLGRDMVSLGLTYREQSKYHARVVWGEKPDEVDDDGLQSAREAGDFQPVLDGAFIACPGVFGWDRIDAGSKLLAEALNAHPVSGRVADFGCGYGYLTSHILNSAEKIYCLDADWRAIESCSRSLKSKRDDINYLWADITDPRETIPADLDAVVMNPPFHEGRAADPHIGISFITRAAQSLKSGGRLMMVANAHLPYEDTLKKNFSKVDKITESGGYKVYHAKK